MSLTLPSESPVVGKLSTNRQRPDLRNFFFRLPGAAATGKPADVGRAAGEHGVPPWREAAGALGHAAVPVREAWGAPAVAVLAAVGVAVVAARHRGRALDVGRASRARVDGTSCPLRCVRNRGLCH